MAGFLGLGKPTTSETLGSSGEASPAANTGNVPEGNGAGFDVPKLSTFEGTGHTTPASAAEAPVWGKPLGGEASDSAPSVKLKVESEDKAPETAAMSDFPHQGPEAIPTEPYSVPEVGFGSVGAGSEAVTPLEQPQADEISEQPNEPTGAEAAPMEPAAEVTEPTEAPAPVVDVSEDLEVPVAAGPEPAAEVTPEVVEPVESPEPEAFSPQLEVIEGGEPAIDRAPLAERQPLPETAVLDEIRKNVQELVDRLKAVKEDRESVHEHNEEERKLAENQRDQAVEDAKTQAEEKLEAINTREEQYDRDSQAEVDQINERLKDIIHIVSPAVNEAHSLKRATIEKQRTKRGAEELAA